MHLRWYICNRDGSEKGEIQDRRGAEVSMALNDQRTGSVTISAEENHTRDVRPGKTRMKVWAYLDRFASQDPIKVLIGNFLIQQPLTSWEQVEFPLVDQSARLLNAVPTRLYPLDGSDDFEASEDVYTDMEISAAMWKLIHDADRRTRQLNADVFDPGDPAPTLGIIQGNLDDTGVERSWSLAEVRTVWDILQWRAKRRHGPDFELEPLDRSDEVHAQFNTHYPRMGTDRSEEIIFELGHNVVDLNWEPSTVELCNRYVLVGTGVNPAVAPVWVAENNGSINSFGLYTKMEQDSFERDPDELQAHAEEYVAKHAWPIDYFELTLPVEVGGTAVGWSRNALGVANNIDGDDYAAPPQFLFDYFLGDIVTIRVQERFRFYGPAGVDNDESTGPQTDYVVRILGVTLTETDDDGNVGITLTCSPDVDKGNSHSYQSYIYLDPA